MRNKERKPIQKTSHTQLRRQIKEKTPKTVEILQSRISQRRKLAIKAAISNLTQVPLSLIVLWPNTKCMCNKARLHNVRQRTITSDRTTTREL